MKVLDLHGYRHHEVPRAVDSFINSNLGEELKIVFGNSPRMRDIVLNTVEPYKFRITRSDIYLNRKYIIILTI